MAPHTKHYHIEDIAATRKHQHLIPGRGAIDFAAVLREIATSGYDGWITVELYPYIDDPDAGRPRGQRFFNVGKDHAVRTKNADSRPSGRCGTGWNCCGCPISSRRLPT